MATGNSEVFGFCFLNGARSPGFQGDVEVRFDAQDSGDSVPGHPESMEIDGSRWNQMETGVCRPCSVSGGYESLQAGASTTSCEIAAAFRNNRWQNFVRTPITHMLSVLHAMESMDCWTAGLEVLSGFGMVVWLPYLYWRSEVAPRHWHFSLALVKTHALRTPEVVVESNFQIQLDIQRRHGFFFHFFFRILLEVT